MNIFSCPFESKEESYNEKEMKNQNIHTKEKIYLLYIKYHLQLNKQ